MTRQIIAILFLVGLFLSCEDKTINIESIGEDLSEKQIDSILLHFEFDYESPIVLDSAKQVIIPISTSLLKPKTRYSKDGYESFDFPRYWNILFYDQQSGTTRLLTKDKMRISRIFAGERDGYEEGTQLMLQSILYEITHIDYNQDGKLNDKDPEHLFSSALNGSDLQRISPKNENLQYFKVLKNDNQLLMRTLRDTYIDSIFNKRDETIWYLAEQIDGQWSTKEVIDSMNRELIKDLYFEQWLKKK